MNKIDKLIKQLYIANRLKSLELWFIYYKSNQVSKTFEEDYQNILKLMKEEAEKANW